MPGQFRWSQQAVSGIGKAGSNGIPNIRVLESLAQPEELPMTKIADPAFWDDNAPDYRGVVNDFTAFYSQCAWEMASLPTDATVLDIAAGGGALTKVASAAGHRVLATDFSPAMVESIAALDLPGVTAQVMDGQDLDLPDASFDAAFSMFGIMLFPDWRAGLHELSRILKPGGTACIGTWKEPGGAAVNLLVDSIAKRLFPGLEVDDPVPGMTEWSDRGRFLDALDIAGLIDARFEEVTSDFTVELPMLMEPEKTFQFSPVWPVLDDDQKADLLDEIRDLAQRGGGRTKVSSPAIIALASKR